MGIPIDQWAVERPANEMESHIMLTVAQAHFHFERKDETYVGVEADEMGYFNERL